jgi:RNA polymerase sigma-70 factor (ECF subfamily)
MVAMTRLDSPSTLPIDASPLGASAEAFGEAISPFRRELLVHCYRMLGSVDDAEDAVQEALARAWRGRATFQQSISVRAWLYRIATNACLDAIERRRRTPGFEGHAGVGPIPDDLLDDAATRPEAHYDARESVSLAFLAALQVLPPRQRAVLILRDVLAWRASEVADLLELSVPAVNSALHRARATMASRHEATAATDAAGQRSPAGSAAPAPGRLRTLLDHYVRAWEAADVDGLVALLRRDAQVSMPPAILLDGRGAIAEFLTGSVFAGGTRIRLTPVQANRMPAFAIYSGAAGQPAFGFFAVMLVDADDAGVGRMSVFDDPRLAARFSLPDALLA